MVANISRGVGGREDLTWGSGSVVMVDSVVLGAAAAGSGLEAKKSFKELSNLRDLILWVMKDFLQLRLQAAQARKTLSWKSSAPSSKCSTVMVQDAGSSVPRGQEMLSQVSHSARARV
ncbi:hypothetical protein AX14_004898 [Amanita brunnescens Koide BX004]|nr:hypothetical protein AX14_004898 [Amanita brunnescens Koide BX004]